MRNMLKQLVPVTCILMVATLGSTGCGGAEKIDENDPVVLLSRGKYAAARAVVLRSGKTEPKDRAIVSISLLAQRPSRHAARDAADSLVNGSSPVNNATAAGEMLSLFHSLPAVDSDEFHILLAETALGACGHGPVAKSKAGPEPGSEISKTVAVASLEQINLWLTSSPEGTLDSDRLLGSWNACYSLMGASLAADTEMDAWKMYTSISGIALVMNDSLPGSDLSRALLRSTVTVVEENPDIAIPVRCDLSSPFDRIRSAVSIDRKLLGRLERSVAVATGCSLGRYAPEIKRP